MTAARQRLHDAALHLFAERGSSLVTISELAEAAGIARGTVYNNIDSLDGFFNELSRDLAQEMRHRMLASFVGVHDPAQRLADGVRFFIRRAHAEPGWGRFVSRFSSVDATVQTLWAGPPMDDVRAGIRRGRFCLAPDDLTGVMAMVSGTSSTAMWLVLEGHETWRTIGSSTATLLLRGLGIHGDEARRIATRDLPGLAPLPATVNSTDVTGADVTGTTTRAAVPGIPTGRTTPPTSAAGGPTDSSAATSSTSPIPGSTSPKDTP